MLTNARSVFGGSKQNAGDLIHGAFPVDFSVIHGLFDVDLFVDRLVVIRLASGAVSDFVRVFVGVHNVHVVLVGDRFLVARGRLARVVGSVVAEREVVGWSSKITAQVFHQRLVLRVHRRVFPPELRPRRRVVHRFLLAQLVVRRLQVVRRRHFLVVLSAFVILDQEMLRNLP